MKTKMSRFPVYGRGGATYCVSGSSWNSSFTMIHIPTSCRRIMGRSISWRLTSHVSRTVICCDHGRSCAAEAMTGRRADRAVSCAPDEAVATRNSRTSQTHWLRGSMREVGFMSKGLGPFSLLFGKVATQFSSRSFNSRGFGSLEETAEGENCERDFGSKDEDAGEDGRYDAHVAVERLSERPH